MDGRSYHLRTRHLPATAAAATKNRALVSVVALPAAEERTLGPDDALGWAWAAHQRERTARGIELLRAVSGSLVARPAELVVARRRVRWLPDRAELVEALQWRGREVQEALLPAVTRTGGDASHDCDCTCAGEPGHAAWTVGAPAWARVEPGALLARLAGGERVRVRLGR